MTDMIEEPSDAEAWYAQGPEAGARLRMALDAAGMAPFDVDYDTGMSCMSRALFDLLGLTPTPDGMWPVAALRSYIHPEDRERVSAMLQQAARDGKRCRSEHRLIRPGDGRVIWVEGDAIVQPDAQGRPRLIGLMRDITARRQAELALQESEARLRIALESARMFMTYADEHSGSVFNVREMARIFGMDPVPGERFDVAYMRGLTHPEDRPAIEATTQRLFREGGSDTREVRIVRVDDGSVRWIERHMTIMDRPDGTRRRLVVARDITARHEMEEALRASETRLRAVLAAVPECVKLIAADGTIAEMNPAGLRMIEAPPGMDVVGLSALAAVAPHQRALWAANLALVCGGQALAWDYEIVGLQGGRVQVEMLAVPMRLADGSPGMLGVSRDVTVRRAAESRLAALQADAMRGARMNALGAMAAGLAHELNQPLSAVANYAAAAGMLAEKLRCGGAAADAPARLHAIIERLQAQAQRGGDIVRRLRDFIAGADRELGLVRVRALADDGIEILRADLRSRASGTRIGLVSEVAPDCGELFCDRQQILQVLTNLLRNAVESIAATEAPGEIVLSAVRHAHEIEFAVSDTGPGIAPEAAAHLFAPFMSTKPSGMGIGLTICRTIVEAHGGRIWAEQDREIGACIRFTVPTGDR